MERETHTTAAAAILGLVLSLPASLSAQAAGTVYKEKNLYDFCQLAECLDGTEPAGNLVIDSAGNIYGTTTSGGAKGGVVFELVPHRRRYRFQLLYAFHINDTLQDPVGDLILDKDGNLYGTAGSGGAYNCGAVFELKPNGGKWSLSALHEFFDNQRVIYFRFREDLGQTKLRFQTDPPDRNYANVGTGVVLVLPKGMQIFLAFRALVGYSDRQAYTANGGLRIAF